MLEIDKNTEDLSNGKEERFYTLIGENQNGIEEKYSIYDCSSLQSVFSLDKYRNVMMEEDEVAIPIIVFRNWEHERELYWKAYENLIKAQDKRDLNNFFIRKISVYTELKSELKLQVDDDGINYLEYEADNTNTEENEKITGFVYNLSLYELKKLFNVTGTYLFKMNVRNGLRKDKTGKQLKKKFGDYLCVGLYDELMPNPKYKKNEEQIKEMLEIDEQKRQDSMPRNFWFYHNGITIYAYNAKMDRTGNHITIIPNEVSVINGAQTLTNFFEEWDRLQHDIPEKLAEIGVDKTEVGQKLEIVSKKIVIKTIFIKGKVNKVKSITNGLNTQIPIFEEDIIATGKTVEEINRYLRRIGMKILKSGEENYNGNGLTVVEFVKRYLIATEKPGTSKNLRKSELEKYLLEAKHIFEAMDEKADELLKKLDVLVDLENWWGESKKDRIEQYAQKQDVILNSYGKNYFFSYFLDDKNEEFSPEYTFAVYGKFIEKMKSIKDNITLADFKNDTLYGQYIALKANDDSQTMEDKTKWELTVEEEDALYEYLSRKNISNYAYAKEIAEFIGKVLKKDFGYFRVVKRDCSTKGFLPKEAFPFPSSTFFELYKDKTDSDISYLDFDESKFKAEICKKYPVFVIDFLGDNTISKFTYIKDFSFIMYIDEAKKVYEKVVYAFEEGNEKMFPKSSDHMGFHIRPKAVNANDTFEFTNGERITKRTFWANKDTVNEIVKTKIKEKESEE